MKNLLKLALVVICVSASSLSFAATSSKITVNGMVCAFCAQGIEKRLSKLPATKAVLVDLKQKTVWVEAKDGMSLEDKKLKAEISDAGYDVVKIEVLNTSVAELKAEMGAKK